MGILGLGDGVGRLGRARSQPEHLLVLGIYLLWRSVYIFMRDVKVQRLSLQASVDAAVNRAQDRCEPDAARSIRGETWPPVAHTCAVPGAARPGEAAFGTPVCGASFGRDCEEGGL